MRSQGDRALRPFLERMAQDHAGSASADAAAEAGLRALGRALAHGDGRGAALDLLVADALITLACADAATAGLPEALSVERFAALLEDV